MAKAIKNPMPDNLEEPGSAAKERRQEMSAGASEGRKLPSAPKVKTPVDRAEMMKGATARHLPEQGKIPGDAYYGHFVTVTKGEHKGAYGVFIDVSQSDDNGYPVTAIVRRRNGGNLIAVPYEDLASTGAGDIERDRG